MLHSILALDNRVAWRYNDSTIITPVAVANFLYILFVVHLQHQALCQQSKIRKHAARAIVECGLTGYGGGLIVPALLGRASFPLSHERALVQLVVAFYLYHSSLSGRFVRAACSWAPFSFILAAGFEVFRTTVMIGWLEAGRATISPQSAALLTGKPIVAWIVCGGIGGSGGGFLPFDRGLSLLDKPNWILVSAFGMSAIYVALVVFAEFQESYAKATVAGILVVARCTWIVPGLQQFWMWLFGFPKILLPHEHAWLWLKTDELTEKKTD